MTGVATGEPAEAALADGAPDDPEPVRAARWPWAVSAALAVASVPLVWLAVVWHGDVSRADRQRALDATVLAIGRQEAVNFVSYDYRTAQHDFQRNVAESTGSFHGDYQALAASLAQTAQAYHAVSVGTVLDAAVVGASSKQASVLVIIDDTIHSDRVKQGRVQHLRLQVLLSRVGTAWLVSGINPVG